MHSVNLEVKKKLNKAKEDLKRVSAFILKAGRQLLHTSEETPHMFSALRVSICSTYFATVSIIDFSFNLYLFSQLKQPQSEEQTEIKTLQKLAGKSAIGPPRHFFKACMQQLPSRSSF